MSTIEHLEAIWKKILFANRVHNPYQEEQAIADAKNLAEALDARIRRKETTPRSAKTAD